MTPPSPRQARIQEYVERAMRAVPLTCGQIHENAGCNPNYPALAALVAAPLGELEEALINLAAAWGLAMSERGGHDEHNSQTDPDTVCLDCWGIRQARAALAGLPWRKTP